MTGEVSPHLSYDMRTMLTVYKQKRNELADVCFE